MPVDEEDNEVVNEVVNETVNEVVNETVNEVIAAGISDCLDPDYGVVGACRPSIFAYV